MPPEISVITATYNDSVYLVEAIQSVLNQTFGDFECIIVDDGSDDGQTPQYIDSFAKKDSRIVALRNKENLGRAASRNRALEIAQGKYIAIMDGDDLSTPDRFEKQVKFLQENPHIGYLGTATRVINKQTGKFIRETEMPLTHGKIMWHFCFSFPFIHSSTMGYRNLFEKAGGYDPSFVRSQDMDLWVRMAKITKFANLPDVLFTYRVGAQRPPKLLRQWSQYAVRVHFQHMSNLLGFKISEKTGMIILKSVSDRHSDTIPSSYEEVLEAINNLMLIYKHLQRDVGLTPEEESFIQQDLSIIISTILYLYPDYLSDFMNSNIFPYIGAAYWRKKIPGGLWRIPFAMLHPITSLKLLRNKLRDR
jgi:glycosyltransferase involved in cell wall biosynthesis